MTYGPPLYGIFCFFCKYGGEGGQNYFMETAQKISKRTVNKEKMDRQGEHVRRNHHNQVRTAKSTHHPHKIDDQHRECKTGGGAYFAFLLGSDNSHTTSPKIPPDEKGLVWEWLALFLKVPLEGVNKNGVSNFLRSIGHFFFLFAQIVGAR